MSAANIAFERRLAAVVISFAALLLVIVYQLSFEINCITSSLIQDSARGIRATSQSNVNLLVSGFHSPNDDPILSELGRLGAERSIFHMKKISGRISRIATIFNKTQRYQPVVRQYAAIPVSQNYAFLHIFKCGGTTIVELTDEKQLPLVNTEIQSRYWFALVRDPINRMLSAWAECGVRLYEGEINFNGHERYSSLNWLEEEYDFRIRAFLREVKDYLPPRRSCHTHAFPQANFMLNSTGHVDEHIRFVGDLSEMRAALQVAGLRLGSNHLIGRDASLDLAKIHYFPSRRDLLSDETMLELCEFYAIDYFLFDFKPPTICTQEGGPLPEIL